MFSHIRDPTQLPELGAPIGEGYVLDFKAKPTDDTFEIAKDVAALANAFGGTILVGAAEKGNRVTRYLPLTEQVAQTAEGNYHQAIRDRCQPAPQLSIDHIAKDGGLVMAINVWPAPGQPIGVRLLNGEVHAGNKPKQLQNVFYYPQRVGSNTRDLEPEQLPMLVDAKMRRFAASLARGVGQEVHVTSRMQERNSGVWQADGKILKVDPDAGCFFADLFNVAKFTNVAVPIDEVDAVWFDGSKWQVVIRGQVQTNPGRPGVRYVPEGS